MERLSNRDRGVRAAEEARGSGTGKTSKARKGTTVRSSATVERSKPAVRPAQRAVVKPVRMKVVWEVCSGSGKTIQVYPYPDKAAAEARTRALIRTTRRAHLLRATHVPME